MLVYKVTRLHTKQAYLALPDPTLYTLQNGTASCIIAIHMVADLQVCTQFRSVDQVIIMKDIQAYIWCCNTIKTMKVLAKMTGEFCHPRHTGGSGGGKPTPRSPSTPPLSMVQSWGHRSRDTPCYSAMYQNHHTSLSGATGVGRYSKSPTHLISKQLALSQLNTMRYMTGLSVCGACTPHPHHSRHSECEVKSDMSSERQ